MADLSMPPADLDAFLTEERVLRLGTVDDEGWPAVVPLWFVWHEEAIWVWNLTRARRTRRLREGTRCAFTVDAGVDYGELRGASGRLEYAFVPDEEVPLQVRAAFSAKYLGTDEPLEPADHHQWLRMVPSTLRTWDFRRLAGS